MNAAVAATAVLISLWAIVALRRQLPSSWPRAPRRQAATNGVAGDLERVQRTVASTTFAGDVHWRLRPMLREVAAAGLLRHRVVLDQDPDRARALMTPDTWDLVRPNRPRPDDPFAPGLGAARLNAVLDDLEALLR